VADLARLTRDALDRGLRAAGWKPSGDGSYDRRVNRQFELVTQVWVEGEPVVVQSLLSLECPRLWMVLVHLGEDEREPAVRRDPLEADPVVERADQIEAAVPGVVARLEAAAERMEVYADVDAFAAALASEEETREDSPVVVPALLAATGRKREARERVRLVPGDFAERLDGWLRGERPPPPPGFGDVPFDWRGAFAAAREKAREREAEPPGVRAQRPQASWGDVFRTGRGLVRMFRDGLPPTMPARDEAWTPVELNRDAPPVLEAARRAAPLPIWQNAWIEARIEPDGRVLVDGAEVGTVAARGEAATVPGKIERNRRDAPLGLAVQLRSPA
jgi:hypothetical protein